MKQLRATYTVVTPMFLGGADPRAGQVGFRPPSFKGALRFWWRALAWSEVVEAVRDVPSALRELHRRESDLFGSAAGEHTGGQSRVLLSADWQPEGTVAADAVRSAGRSGQEDGIGYLMGQGLKGRNAAAGGQISVLAIFRPGTGEGDRKDVERALLMLGLLGGLGSRARRGFGSLTIAALEGDRQLDLAPPRNVEGLRTALATLIVDRAKERPPYSAFSARSRVDLSLVGGSAAGVHAAVGGQMQELRQALGDDTRRAREAADGKKPDQPPERSAFGLPLQFYFKRDRAKVFVEPAVRKEDRMDRRASPLLIQVHRFEGEPGADQFGVVQTFLPAQFLPRGKGIRVQVPRKAPFDFPGFSPPEALILGYLDAFTGRRTMLP